MANGTLVQIVVIRSAVLNPYVQTCLTEEACNAVMPDGHTQVAGLACPWRRTLCSAKPVPTRHASENQLNGNKTL